jgi:cytochrome c-type biogenesis protein CcmH
MSAWTIIAILSCLCLLPLMWAIAPRPGAADVTAASADTHHYRAQIDEIARLEAQGALGLSEAESARLEAARRLIAAKPDNAAKLTPEVTRRLSVALSILLLAGVPAIAAPLYFRFGQPSLPDMPLVERRAEDPDSFRALDMQVEIEAAIGVNPDDGPAQERAARIYMQLGRFGDASRAFGAATRILGETPERLSGRALAIVYSENGVVSPEARQFFARALALDPANGAARFYGGMALKQDGRKEEAAAIWQSLWLDTPEADLRKVIEAQLAEIGSALPQSTPKEPAQ